MPERATRTWAVVALVCAVLTAGCAGPPPRTAIARSADGAGPPREAVEAAVERLAEATGAPGGAAYTRDGDGTWFGSTGVADRRSERRIGRTDRFRAGSLTKTFVATVVLQLCDEGTLRLSDTVADRLPGLVRGQGNDGRRITVRQLLSHTSGLFDYAQDPQLAEESFGPGFAEHRYDPRTPQELVRAAVRHEPYAAPGEEYRYSNTDYILLGLLIEAATGRTYAQEIEERIIGPLGLTGTSLPGNRHGLPEPHGRAYSAVLAPEGPAAGAEISGSAAGSGGVGSTKGAGGAVSAESAGGLMDVTELDPSTAGAAGEMISTLGDLSRFMGALLGGELLPPEKLRRMRDTSRTDGVYGAGLFPVRLSCGLTVWGHNGSINGSYVQVAGTLDGSHLLGYRVNTESAGAEEAEDRLLTAEFCRDR
ncbi:MAG TPA: serine hydrolase [Streptomyces sp.]|nr:serine hydrolase [Streptomyces sp.]